MSAFLAGCGGGGTGDPGGQQVQATCHDTVTVQLFGDSTQWLVSYYGNLQANLDLRFGAGRVMLVDQAQPGTDSTQLIAGTDGLNPPWPQDVSADIAVVNHGANDDGHHVPLDQYRADMETFAATPGVQMVIETPDPWDYAVDPHDDTANAAVAREVAAAAGVPLIDVQAYVLSVPNWKSMVRGGIHPNADLDAAIARDVTAPGLAPLIAARLCSR